MKRLLVSIPTSIHLYVEVEDEASDDDIKQAVNDECPKYVELKAGTHFDPDSYEILDVEAGSDEDPFEWQAAEYLRELDKLQVQLKDALELDDAARRNASGIEIFKRADQIAKDAKSQQNNHHPKPRLLEPVIALANKIRIDIGKRFFGMGGQS